MCIIITQVSQNILTFNKIKIFQVIKELREPELNGEYVTRHRVPWAEWVSEVEVPINLDGEPIRAKSIHYEAIPGAIKLVLPESCPLTNS